MNPAEERDDFYTIVLSELKSLGVKVPKTKKFKLNIAKQDKVVSSAGKRIFGANLSDQEFVSDSGSTLPKFVSEATAYLRCYSVADGLFRKAGSIARQRDLQDQLENGASLAGSDPNVNDVASLLKQWLRELPEPIIPPYLEDLLIRCVNLDTHEKRCSATLLSCLLLRTENLYTLRHLFQFLAEIAANSDKNRMNVNNLALVMAPNLFNLESSRVDKLSNNLQKSSEHTSVVELLIKISPKFGEIPPTIASRINDQVFQMDNLDYSPEGNLSPSKSKKKRRSGSVQDIFSGIRKLVGQPHSPVMDAQQRNHRSASVCRSASKRKADPDQCLLSPAKKNRQALSAEQEDVTPIGKAANARKHNRIRSFNLLRRKERKSYRTPDSKHISKKSSPPVVVQQTYDKTQNNSQKVERPLPSKASPPKMQFLPLPEPTTGIKKSTSDCLIKSFLEEFKEMKTVSSSAAEGSLPTKPEKLSTCSSTKPVQYDDSFQAFRAATNNSSQESKFPIAIQKENVLLKRNEATRKSSRKRLDNFGVPQIKVKFVHISNHGNNLDSGTSINDLVDDSNLEDAVWIPHKDTCPSLKKISLFDMKDKENVLVKENSFESSNAVYRTEGTFKSCSDDNVFVSGSPKRSSSRRKLKMENPRELSVSSSSIISMSQNIKSSSDPKMKISSKKMMPQNTDTADPKLNKNSDNLSALPNTTPNTTYALAQVNANIKKGTAKVEVLKPDPLLNRKNSSRRRKREVTHAKSLDSSKRDQFKRSSTTTRSLRVSNSTMNSEKISLETKSKCDKTVLDEDEKVTPQKNCLLRRDTKSSLRRGRPNTIKSGLPSEFCQRKNGSVLKMDDAPEEAKSLHGDMLMIESCCIDTNDNASVEEVVTTVCEESLSYQKTLLEDICDTLQFSLLNENLLESADSQVEIPEMKYFNDNSDIEDSASMLLQRHKRSASCLTPISTKINESIKKKLSHSDSKIITRKNSHVHKRIKSDDCLILTNESQVKKKKTNTNSIDEPLTEKHKSMNLSRQSVGFNDSNILNQSLNILDDNSKDLSLDDSILGKQNPTEHQVKEKLEKLSTSSFDELNINPSHKKTEYHKELIQDSIDSSDCAIKSPSKTEQVEKSPTKWVKASQYFDAELLDVDDLMSNNKRESIVQILKNKSGNVLAKIHQYDSVARATPVKNTPLSSTRPMSENRRSSSQKGFKTPNTSKFNSARKASSTKTTRTRMPLAPPPKFVITDSSVSSPAIVNKQRPTTDVASAKENTPNQRPITSAKENTPLSLMTKDRKDSNADSPVVSHPLQELTNINSLKDSSPVVGLGCVTPMKDPKHTPGKGGSTETKYSARRIKPKRNSYSGHTPFKLKLPIARSESSPMIDKGKVRYPRRARDAQH